MVGPLRVVCSLAIMGKGRTRKNDVILPIVRTNHRRLYTWTGNQLQEGRDNIPGVGTNHRRGESIYLEWEPITGGKRV